MERVQPVRALALSLHHTPRTGTYLSDLGSDLSNTGALIDIVFAVLAVLMCSIE